MKKLWKRFWNVFALKQVWDSFFMNDAHFIVSRRGLEILYKMQQKRALIELMDMDAKNGLYDDYSDDMKAYVHQYNNEEELRREGAIDFAKWLASDWMSIWVVDKWMWEWQHERTRETFNKYKEYYTEEELYELYLEETQ